MIKDGIIKHANVNAKFIASGKTIIIQAHVFVRLVSISNVLKILQWLSALKLYLLWILPIKI